MRLKSKSSDEAKGEGANRPSPTERSQGGAGGAKRVSHLPWCGAFSFFKVKLCDLVHTL